MLRFAVLAVLLAAVWAAPTTEDSTSADLGVVVVDNIEEYLAKNPAIGLAQEMDSEYLADRHQFRYSFGRRIGGDRQVANNNYNQQYPRAQDVKATLNYPTQGVGSIITFVQIVVDQSSNQGRAYVVNGGLNQRNISIVIEATRTTLFNYNAQIFGYN